MPGSLIALLVQKRLNELNFSLFVFMALSLSDYIRAEIT